MKSVLLTLGAFVIVPLTPSVTFCRPVTALMSALTPEGFLVINELVMRDCGVLNAVHAPL